VLLDADDPEAVASRWSRLLVATEQVGRRDLGGWVLSRALQLAAERDRTTLEPVLDRLLPHGDPLIAHVAPALAATYDTAASRARAERALASADERVRAVAVRAVGWSPLPDRVRLLAAMARDPSLNVRRAVVDVLRFDADPALGELELALEACLPADVESLVSIIYPLKYRQSEGRAPLDDAQAARAAAVVLAAAARDRLPGRELGTIIEFLAPYQPRLAIEFCRARVTHQQADTRERDLNSLMRIDALPDELRDAVRDSAGEADIVWALDQLAASGPADPAHGTLRDILEWLDYGQAIITDRIAAWHRSENDRLRYEAERVLDHPLSAEAFRERSRQLLRSGGSGPLEDAIVGARHPQFWSGTRHRYWRQLRDEFSAWTEDPDEALAEIGHAAVSYYERLLEDEEQPEEGDDYE
jgi:hypothetical protein